MDSTDRATIIKHIGDDERRISSPIRSTTTCQFASSAATCLRQVQQFHTEDQLAAAG